MGEPMDIVRAIEDALQEIEEFAQPRSDFALAHFVIAQHDLPARQRKQILDELQVLLYAIYDLRDKRELAEIELEELEAAQPENDFEYRRNEVRRRQLRREIWNIDFALRGREREAMTLLRLLEQMPKFTREEFEAQEAEYWKRRLTRQWQELQLGGGGNLSSLLSLMTVPGHEMPLLPGQKNLINLIEVDIKKLIDGEKK
jgi:Tfp pilus assembly protein PilN